MEVQHRAVPSRGEPTKAGRSNMTGEQARVVLVVLVVVVEVVAVVVVVGGSR